jgi:uncharacterized membrane protein
MPESTRPDTTTSGIQLTIPEPRAPQEETLGGRPSGPRRVLGAARRFSPRYTWSGTVGALLLGYASFTPSLMPRSWLLQGIIAGISAATGYGLAVVVAWFVRELTDGDRTTPGVRRRAWQALAVVGPVAGVVMLWLGRRWQNEIHRLMEQPKESAYRSVLTVLLAALLFALLIGIGRGLRWLTRRLIRLLARVIPRRVARPLSAAAVIVVSILLLNGVLVRGLIGLANSAFSVKDHGTEAGAVRPAAAERSGSPASLVSWQSLGLQGRTFVGSGPTTEELSAFSGRPAREPVRIYAGLESAAAVEDRADLAVRDLRRAGGFSRAALVVVTTTGTGWVDPAAAEALEYELNGDTAMVAMQYSYLPSWISFLVDQAKARDAGRALFDAVYGAWARLPFNDRPRLYVYGESLGSFGGEAAFSGLGDIRNRTNGVLWAGPPNFNQLWRGLVADRTPGSPEWLPEYQDGRTVRWADRIGDLDRPAAPWNQPRVVYLQNASDPVVWWSPRLIFSHPDWLRGRRGSDVSQDMVWIPVVSFWQVTADMTFAVNVPQGHGHHYVADYADGWAAVVRPPDWTPADTARLRALLVE